ncbi:hydrolase [Microbacterium phage Footloose]|uniref:Hydrolase n=1 Tax=Microbacterium phage Footloose TaxID=2836048 RepID=A0A8F3IQD4_9CAUD|nr:hydrolase [Microbacterium phage Footloose]QWY84610.1 hydrolase [Microbacterium phage Footloose]
MKKRWRVIIPAVAVTIAIAGTVFIIRENRIQASECELVETLEQATSEPIGTGTPVTVVGDSYTQGFGLENPRASWVLQLSDMEATVSASSGAGFTREGLCDTSSLSALADKATGPVILQGGLNDVGGDMTALADRVDTILNEHDVIAIVGPTKAPAFNADQIADVNETLADTAEQHGITYIDTTGWDLPFSDGIHLTASGHEQFGRQVADQLDE